MNAMLVTFNSKKRTNKSDDIRESKAPKLEPIPNKSVFVKRETPDPDPDDEPTPDQTINTSFKLINKSTDFFKAKSSKRSKNGCLICKIRKKKCDEQRPYCSGCSRLNKDCVWIDPESMSEEEIRVLKEKAENEERHRKLRKRKSKSDTASASADNIAGASVSQASSGPGEIKTKARVPIHTEPDIAYSNISSILPPKLISEQSSPGEPLRAFRYSHSDIRSTLDDHNITKSHRDSPISHLLSLQNPDDSHLDDTTKNNLNLLADSASQSASQPTSPSSNPFQATSPNPDSSRSPFSPSLFLSFLKDQACQDSPVEKVTMLQEANDKGETQSQDKIKDIQDLTIHQPNLLLESQLSELGPMFSNPESPYYAQYLQLMCPSGDEDLIPNLNSIITPLPPHPPSYLPELSTPGCSYLYHYYVETLSNKICIAPSSQNESNSYQKVFLPLAHKDKGVLYGILAWAGFHLGGKWKEEGSKYVDMALEHLMKSLTELNPNGSQTGRSEDRQVTIVKLATLLILCGAEICKGDVKNWSIFLNWGWKILYAHGGILNFNSSKEEHWLISNFAYHDLLASSSTERGTYFPSEDYATIFKDKEGFSRGNLNPLLGVSKKLYKIIGDISTLVYESKKILERFYSEGIIEIENKVGVDESPAYTSLDIECSSEDGDSEVSEHGKINRMLLSIVEKANILEKEIDSSRPDPEDLVGITDSELEWQLTLFEAFQLSAKLFLKQSIMKCNPSMIEIQVLNTDLIKCIDILLGTPVQASLVFPLFMSGIHCVSKHDRQVLLQRMTNLMELYGPWNIQRAKFLVEKVWEQNPRGNTVVDWQCILKDLGWDINFA